VGVNKEISITKYTNKCN